MSLANLIMSFFLATLLPGILLFLLGLPLVLGNSNLKIILKAIPRSPVATWIFFGSGALWFIYEVWTLSQADFGDYHVPLTIGFAFVAAFAFKCVPDFLAVRGLAILILLAAWPELRSDYMRWDPQRLYLVGFVYLCIVLAIWLGAQPWRMRDFLDWLFDKPARAKLLGAALALYGLALCAAAFTIQGPVAT